MTKHRDTFLRLAPLGLAVLCALSGMPGQVIARDPGRIERAPAEAPQRFIVKYRSESQEHRDAAARERSLHRAASAVQVRDPSALGGMRAIRLQHVRRMALGADVIVSSHALDRAAADTLMRRFATDPRVEYVEVDARMQSMRLAGAALSPVQVEQLLKANVTAFPSTPDRPIGTGIANADAAVRAAQAF